MERTWVFEIVVLSLLHLARLVAYWAMILRPALKSAEVAFRWHWTLDRHPTSLMYLINSNWYHRQMSTVLILTYFLVLSMKTILSLMYTLIIVRLFFVRPNLPICQPSVYRTDMCKQIEALTAIEHLQYHGNLNIESLFLFCGRRANRIKVL